MADEYAGSNILELFPLDRVLGEEGTVESKNIFKGTLDECLSSKNPWYDLIGGGCGANDKVDCVENYHGNDTVTCSPNSTRESCWTEAGCFQGAGKEIANSFRPGFNTIMNNNGNYGVIDLASFSRGYGPVNEREICRRIKKEVGSAGGVCTNDYGIH